MRTSSTPRGAPAAARRACLPRGQDGSSIDILCVSAVADEEPEPPCRPPATLSIASHVPDTGTPTTHIDDLPRPAASTHRQEQREMSNGDHDGVGVGRPARSRRGGREWAAASRASVARDSVRETAPGPRTRTTPGLKGRPAVAARATAAREAMAAREAVPAQATRVAAPEGHRAAAAARAAARSIRMARYRCIAGMPVCPRGAARVQARRPTPARRARYRRQACASPRSTWLTYSYQEVDTPLSLLAISPIPGGGSRLAFMGSDKKVHVALLDGGDNLVAGSTFALPAYDFQTSTPTTPAGSSW